MNHSELSRFTHAELSNFTQEELAMIPADLLRKVLDDDRPLPPSIVKKVQELCNELPGNAPKPKKLESFKDAFEVVIKIGTYIKLAKELSEMFSPKLQALFEQIETHFR